MAEKEPNSIIKLPGLKMVAAGAGGRLLESEVSDPVFQEALDISGARKPNVLTIATAEPTKDWYDEFIEGTERRFGGLGADVVNLHDFRTPPSEAELEDKLHAADVVWVAGGDTGKMMEFWKEHGIGEGLTDAALRGVVMSGGSAGMLAWMKQGHSDSLSYRVPEGEDWEYIFVPGMGYVDVTAVPHFDTKKDGTDIKRSDDFKGRFVANDSLPELGLGIDNMAALSVIDGNYRVVSVPDKEFPSAGVHLLTKSDSTVIEERLPVHKGYKTFKS